MYHLTVSVRREFGGDPVGWSWLGVARETLAGLRLPDVRLSLEDSPCQDKAERRGWGRGARPTANQLCALEQVTWPLGLSFLCCEMGLGLLEDTERVTPVTSTNAECFVKIDLEIRKARLLARGPAPQKPPEAAQPGEPYRDDACFPPLMEGSSRGFGFFLIFTVKTWQGFEW